MNSNLLHVLEIVNSILSYGLTVVFVILYYVSIKKCFWKGNISKVKLFFMTFISNPVFLYLISFLSVALVISSLHLREKLNMDLVVYRGYVSLFCTLFYILLIFLISDLIGKKLQTQNRILVSFVTMMYSVILSLMMKNDISSSENAPDYSIFVDIAGFLALYLATFLVYRFFIYSLSKLTDKKLEINSRLFTVPLTVFTLYYNIFSVVTMELVNTLECTLIFLYSIIIVYLFIWAFSVIIKNINATNEAIEAKDLAAAAAIMEARIEADLSIAKEIQTSALPNEFPSEPEFELFASMNAAKEVGGDFYDFYMLNDDTLGFLIADVSGKSIPGAMFMMTSKTVIKSLAENDNSPAEVFTMANEKLCEGNDAEMFVTAWLGYLDVNSGLVRVANAGHNPPVLIRNGKAEYVVLKPGLMLAGMDGVRYKEQIVQLEKGDMLFLYTDGVTEAMNVNEEQYGEDRLKEILSFGDKYSGEFQKDEIVKSVCKTVGDDIALFTEGAEQSDDITMLCIRYIGG